MKKKPAKHASCNCVKEVNEQLAPFNTQIAQGFHIDFESGLTRDTIYIATEKFDPMKHKPTKNVVASYCPFCGRKLE